MEKPAGYTTLRRGLALIDALSSTNAIRQGGMTVGELARQLDFDKSQVSRALAVLVDEGYVVKDPGARLYRVGWKQYAAAMRATEGFLLQEAHEELEKLVVEFGENAHMVVLEGTHSVAVATVKSYPTVRHSWIGRSLPVYYAASGRALIMNDDLKALETRLASVELERPTPDAPESVEELWRRLVAQREQGYVIVDGEMEPGLLAVAAPVSSSLSATRSAIGLAGSARRLRPRIHEAGRALVASAQRLARSGAAGSADES